MDFIYCCIKMSEIKEYSQFVEEKGKINFDSQEAQKVMSSVKKELEWLKAIVAKNPSKWWEKSNVDEALKIVDDPTKSFYKLEANNKVTYNLDKVSSYLSVVYNRILKPGWPKKYIDQKNEKIFRWTILAVQIALESIKDKNWNSKKYDIWVINWILDNQTVSALKKFQKDYLWISEMDWKPWKKTIWKILWILNAKLIQSWKKPEIQQKKPEIQQKKPTVQTKKQDIQTTKVDRLKWWAEIIRDWKIAYVTVEPGDTTQTIRNRVGAIPEFSYLNNNIYAPIKAEKWRSYVGFNIRNDSLKAWNKIPVPIEIKERQKTDKEFFESSKQAIDRILNWSSEYKEKVKKLVNSVWKDNVALVMTAFAKKETTSKPSELIWTWQLYRYENSKRYSISYFHILMEWAWANARDKLWFKDSDLYNPINAWMLFLWYWSEVKWDKMANFLDPRKAWWAVNAASVYNSKIKNSYWASLLRHYEHAKESV